MKADPCGCRSGSTVLQPGMFLVASFQNGANLFAECCTPRAVFTRIPGLEKKQPSSQKDEQQKARDLCLFTNNEKSIKNHSKKIFNLFYYFCSQGPVLRPGFLYRYFLYNIQQDAGIRTRVAATAARSATNEQHTFHPITFFNLYLLS